MTKLQTFAAMAVGVLTATLGGFEAHAQTLQDGLTVAVARSSGGTVHGGETLVRMRVRGRGAQASVGSVVSSTDASFCAQRWTYYDPASGKYMGDDGQWRPCR
jgi:BA14K-like protein